MSNSKDFSGKVVIITGSSSGIGEGTAIVFSKLGANVVITGRNGDNVKRVAKECQSVSPKGLKALQVIADITKDEDAKRLIESTIEEFGKIDVLVNNAGAGWLTNILDENVMENYEKVMKIDLRAVVYLTHLTIPYLEKTKGNIVNISSVGGIKPFGSFFSYCMAKSALDMFTKCMALELGPKGIRINGLNVGGVITNFTKAMNFSEQIIKANEENLVKSSPIGIIGKPEHIANTVAFLASDEAVFITGTNMLIDGGVLWSSIDIKLD